MTLNTLIYNGSYKRFPSLERADVHCTINRYVLPLSVSLKYDTTHAFFRTVWLLLNFIFHQESNHNSYASQWPRTTQTHHLTGQRERNLDYRATPTIGPRWGSPGRRSVASWCTTSPIVSAPAERVISVAPVRVVGRAWAHRYPAMSRRCVRSWWVNVFLRKLRIWCIACGTAWYKASTSWARLQ